MPYKQCFKADGTPPSGGVGDCNNSTVRFIRSVYLSNYNNNTNGSAFRVVARLTVVDPQVPGATTTFTYQSVLSNTSGGCLGTGTHPFSGPCATYLYGQALLPQGTITITPNAGGGLNGDGLDLGSAGLTQAVAYTPQYSANLQSEQVQLVQGLASTSGLALQATSDTSARQIGKVSQATGADNDQGQPDVVTDQKTVTDSSIPTAGYCEPNINGCSTSSGPGQTQIIVKKTNADGTTKSTSTTNAQAASGAGQACSTQTDNQPCGYASGRLSGSEKLEVILHLYDGATYLGTCTLVEATAPTSGDSSALTDRTNPPQAPPATPNPSITSQLTRQFGQVSVGCLPSAIGKPSGWANPPASVGGGTEGFLLRLKKDYTQGPTACPVKANAGYGVSAASAPGYATSLGGSCSATAPAVFYWNQSGTGIGSYSTQTHSAAGTTYCLPINTGCPDNSSSGFGPVSLVYTANGCTFTEQIPVGQKITSGPGTVTNAAATGSPSYIPSSSSAFSPPMFGNVLFRVVCGATTVADLNISVNFGQATSSATYAPPPT